MIIFIFKVAEISYIYDNSLSPKNILIIGGTGFIGYHLAKICLKKGWSVTSISTKFPKKNRHLPKVKYTFCDIAKKESLKRSINKGSIKIRNVNRFTLF